MIKRLIILSLILSSGCAHKNERSSRITLFHTNDIHGHLENFPSFHKLVQETRKNDDHVILLDAGDTFSDTMESMDDQGETVASSMKTLDYHAIVPGNHDFDYGIEQLKKFSRQGLPIISTNLTEKKSGKQIFPSYKILKVGQSRVAIIGVTYPKTPYTTAKKNTEGVKFNSDLEQLINTAVKEVQNNNAHIIILLTHLGLAHDIELAKRIQGINLIVGGHSHNRISSPLIINNIPILQSGAHLQDVGKAKILINDKDLVIEDYSLVKLNPSRLNSGSEVIIGASTEIIPRSDVIAGKFPRKRKSQSPADSLFADLILKYYKSDAVILPGVGYGLPLPKGKITLGDLKNLIPHQGSLYKIKLKGHKIKEILEQSLENVFTKDLNKKIGGLVQVSGIYFSYKPDADQGQRIQDLKIQGLSFDSEKEYELITLGLLEDGGHFYETFSSTTEKTKLPETYPDLIIRLIKDSKVITPPKDIRFIEIPSHSGDSH